jgi:predicted MFS family arabinose efflux permease
MNNSPYLNIRGDEKLSKQPILFLIGGILALIIAMGIGRFAYTPILPLMQNDVSISYEAAGYLASSNYTGYLIGAVLVGITSRKRRIFFFRLSLVISILTTAFMGLTHSYEFWFTLRFFSGLSSAFVFVLASGIVLDNLDSRGKTYWSGIFFGGVGLGIFYTGLMVPILNHSFGWEGVWIGLAITSGIISFLVLVWLKDDTLTSGASIKKDTFIQFTSHKWLPWLIVAYGCEGFGYIVTGTFIVSIAEKISGFNGDANLVWILVGLASTPSCVIWSSIGKKWGLMKSLVMAMVLQSAGIVVPVFWISPVGCAIGAILFGATFMGITTLTTTFARQINPIESSRILGFLTTIYAVGQIIGPTSAGIITSFTHNYNSVLLGSGGVVLVGACFLTIGMHVEKKLVCVTNKDITQNNNK